MSPLLLVFLPHADPTLTAENVMEVMGEVVNWQRVAQGGPFRHGLCVPNSKLQEIQLQSSSERDRSHSLGVYWVKTDPDASWRKLATALYQSEEEKAVAMTKQYLPKGICSSWLPEIRLTCSGYNYRNGCTAIFTGPHTCNVLNE